MFGMGGSKPKAAPRAGASTKTAKPPALVTVSARLTPAQKDKLVLLGGDAWLRARIDEAPTPTLGT